MGRLERDLRGESCWPSWPLLQWRKLLEHAKARDPVDPFIDRKGYLASIDRAEKEFREVLAEQQ